MAVAIGTVIDKRYRVDEFIATGGMGVVYRVWDLKRNTSLAMKVLHDDFSDDPAIFEKFRREARALQQLAHPHIVPFYGMFQTSTFAYLLEGFVNGPSLADVIKKAGGPLPVLEIAACLKAITAALGYAHAQGIVHCDLKPANILIDQTGTIYLADFGIARHANSVMTTLATAGTPAYMSPEQIRGEALTAAADIYALGVMLYEMATGRRPFTGAEAGSAGSGQTAGERVQYAHTHLAPTDPRRYAKSLPEKAAALILQTLAKEPGQRPASAREVYLRFCEAVGLRDEQVPERAWGNGPVTGPLPGPAPVEGMSPMLDETVADELPGAAQGKPVRGKLPAWTPWAGGAAVAALLMALFMILQQPPGPAPTPTAAPVQATAGRTSVAAVQPSRTPRPPTRTPTATPLPSLTPTATQDSFIVKVNAKDGAEMVYVPAGAFTMGDNKEHDPLWMGAEYDRHTVELNAYYIYRDEVTNALYQKCVDANICARPLYLKSHTRPQYFEDPAYADYPVVFMTWAAAASYCNWAGGKLPTEAQWEKAARGTDARRFPWGNDLPNGQNANICDRNCPNPEWAEPVDDGQKDTAPVRSYPAGVSPYGAYDMSGNAYEWVMDWFSEGYYQRSPGKNPTGPASGAYRVMRGGAFYYPNQGARTTGRFPLKPRSATAYTGFRCVQEAAK